MRIDPYQILKVHPGSKLEDIKKAYIKLVKIHHPDKGGDEKLILEINAAWEILKKEHKNFNLDKSNNAKVYNHNEYKKEANNYSNSEEIKNWFKSIYIPIDNSIDNFCW